MQGQGQGQWVQRWRKRLIGFLIAIVLVSIGILTCGAMPKDDARSGAIAPARGAAGGTETPIECDLATQVLSAVTDSMVIMYPT